MKRLKGSFEASYREAALSGKSLGLKQRMTVSLTVAVNDLAPSFDVIHVRFNTVRVNYQNDMKLILEFDC